MRGTSDVVVDCSRNHVWVDVTGRRGLERVLSFFYDASGPRLGRVVLGVAARTTPDRRGVLLCAELAGLSVPTPLTHEQVKRSLFGFGHSQC